MLWTPIPPPPQWPPSSFHNNQFQNGWCTSNDTGSTPGQVYFLVMEGVPFDQSNEALNTNMDGSDVEADLILIEQHDLI